MLGQAIHNIFDQSFITVIDLLGVPCDYKCVKDATNNKTNITVGTQEGLRLHLFNRLV